MNIENYTLSIRGPEDMENLGAALSRHLIAGDLVLLRGCLGAGKTTLVRGLACAAGYTGKVTSPSFTLMNIYSTEPPLHHFDFYRLESGELEDLGLDDYVGHEGIALIEWPEIAAAWLPEEYLCIDISLAEDDYERERLVSISCAGASWRQRMGGLIAIVDSGD